MSLPSNMPGDYKNKRGDKAISKKKFLAKSKELLFALMEHSSIPYLLDNLLAFTHEENEILSLGLGDHEILRAW